MVRNRGYEWTVDRYMDLCAAGPWRRFSSMDLCVEPEVARDEEAVLDRISGTIRLNNACLRAARERGIEDRFMPVIQGWGVDHYLRCLDRMFDVSPFPVIGVGSMCRRHVKGQHGILQVVDALDRALGGGSARTRLHLFGLKSSGMAELRGHPRVASVDSQAYGIAARQNALRGGFSKTTVYLASVMADWYRQQVARLSEPAPYRFRAPPGLLELRPPPPENPVERRMASAAEDLRALHEAGEIEWTDLNPLAVQAWASDDEEAEGATDAPSDDVAVGAPLRPAA